MSASLREAELGRLPDWAQVDEKRRAHIARVAALMEEWARARDLDEATVRRWRAAGWLHDALRTADPETLRPLVPSHLQDLAPSLLHGPAAAERLRAEGVTDEALLLAIGFHTIGHVRLDACGRALFAADYLEPGRKFGQAERAALRARMPHDIDSVLPVILRARIAHLLEAGHRIRAETLDFWNSIAPGAGERAP
jgi:2-amino-4-hydroxy-6-hydroxymethyldihydropteridine diphosphokinase